MQSKVLITGVAGFIGSHVARHCSQLGFKVIGTDDLSGGFIENIPEDILFIKGDLRDKDFVASLWNEGPFDYVYHIAAYAAEGLSHFIRRYNYETNLIASINLINQSVLNKVKCFVFTSSIAVYGANQVPMHEGLVPTPEDPYGISKYAVELDLKCAHHMFGLNFIIFRPHNVYGEKQNIADKYRNVVGIFMNQVLQDKPLTIFGDGNQKRAFSFIDDVAPIIANSVNVENAYNEIFNIGGENVYTVNELAETISHAFGVPLRVQYLPARLEVIDAHSDHNKIKHYFDVPKSISLKDGIKKMSSWVKSIGSRVPIEFNDIEVGIKLPPSWIPTKS
jgi:UDP-glucose 4-epimerase